MRMVLIQGIVARDLKGNTIRSDNEIRVGTRIHGVGTIVRKYSDRPVKSACQGCTDDFYNGNNPLGVAECWAFKKARVVDKIGYSSIHVANGPDTIMRETLSCWHAVRK